ncbi:hypothetical protein CDA63_01675 [Hymenobacter amundsenii]|uniref:STAS/SEC14 domain-containing protein n=1 Tax=Hymenobacter amundsenii TaxID=2006685 RepID=A0A246FQU4_9BACT|nr:hypothetical protein [Hymenobacter amundsenii]OWP65090.1 hypothetical protein CDA63_01675 [Hymenobacter amundsenii]
MKTLLTTPGLTMAHDAENGWLHLIWRGMHSEEESQACFLRILDQVCLTQVSRILNDATQDEDGWTELTRWMNRDFLHNLADVGIVAMAWVLPDNLQARTDVHRMLAPLDCPMVDTFSDPEAAYRWLQQAPPQGNCQLPTP